MSCGTVWHSHKSSVAETKLIPKKSFKGINAIIGLDIMKIAAQSIVKLAHTATNIQFRPL